MTAPQIIGKKRGFTVLAVVALLGGCAHAPAFAPGAHLTLVPDTELPPPAGVVPGSTERPYHIGPLDRLSFSVFGIPELSQVAQVDVSGRISLPLIGALNVAGRIPEDVSSEVADRLRRQFVRDPHVTVNVEETASQTLTVEGQVREPGVYPVFGRMTLMRAIAQAKGTTEFARLQDVVIFRTVGDREMAALYNLQSIRRGVYPDPEVFAQDLIVIGDSPGRRLFRDILQAAPLLATPVVAVLQRL
jgi:polysaccharide export outer membrane protein